MNRLDFGKTCLCWLGFSLFVVSPLSAQETDPTNGRVEVSITASQSKPTVYSIPVSIDGRPIQAAIDTGSSGLRVLHRPLVSTESGEPGQHWYSFAIGDVLYGETIPMQLSIGSLTGTAQGQDVREIGCERDQPHCPASMTLAQDYGLLSYGRARDGYEALLGINMADDDGPSPLAAIGATAWIIEAPTASGALGRLVLNPRAGERHSFSRFSVRREFAKIRGDLHDAIEGCLASKDLKQTICGNILFDTGARGVALQGSAVQGQDLSDADWDIVPGAPASSARLHITIPHGTGKVLARGGPTIIVVGIIDGHPYDLLYDRAAGQVGVRCRAEKSLAC